MEKSIDQYQRSKRAKSVWPRAMTRSFELKNSIRMKKTLKEKLTSVVDEIKTYPDMAPITFQVYTQLIKDLRCEGEIRDFIIHMDEPKSLGGSDTAPNPVELLLAALGACQEIMYSAYAAMMDIPLSSVKVKVRGELDLRGLFGLDPAIHAGFSEIMYEATIVSNGSEASVQHLREMVEKHCPIMDTLMRPIPVRGKVNIEQPASLET